MDTESETHDFPFDVTRLRGDIRDAMLDELKVAHTLPWNLRPESEQKAVIERIDSVALGMVNRAVILISDKGFPSLLGELVQVRVKDGYQAQVNIPRGADNRHEMMDRQGQEVVLVLADARGFRGTRGAVPITPPAPLLDYAEEAAKVADQAAEGVIWWSETDPQPTYPDVSEMLAANAVGFYQPHEIGRTGWLASRWAVRVAAGPNGEEEVQFFDSEDDAAAFCAEAQAVAVEMPAAPVEEAPAAEAAPVEEKDDDGFVPDMSPAILDALPKDIARFTPHMVTDGAAIFYCWKMTDGTVRCHEDREMATVIADRLQQAEDAEWDTAEDRERKRLAASAQKPGRRGRGSGSGGAE